MSGILFGYAAGLFHKKRYKKSADLFEKFHSLHLSSDRKDISISYLGRCYFYLEDYENALKCLKKAYAMKKENMELLEDDYDYREFIKTGYALSKVFDILGHKALSEEILDELNVYRDLEREKRANFW